MSSSLSNTQDVAPVAYVAPSAEGTGAQLFNDIEHRLRRFTVLPSDDAYVAATLWAAHTHIIDSLESTGRLAFLSPEPGSGKTRCLEVLEPVCRNSILALDLSMAAYYRITEDRKPTILLDEVDAIFGKTKSEKSEDMRRVLNNGYRAGAVVQRVGGPNFNEVHDFHVFGPVAMAGLGNLPDTLMSRSIVINMKRRSPTETVEAYRDRKHRPEGEALRDRLAAWAETVTVDYSDLTLPAGVDDRDADVWEPLILVADAAGGEWPERARTACLSFVAHKSTASVSLGVRLLGEIRRVWPEGQANMTTSSLLTALHGLTESPWGTLGGTGLDARGLAGLLRQYGVSSKDVRVGELKSKGYTHTDFWDSWTRYVPEERATKATEATDPHGELF
jgi:hypothetical protein